MQSLTFGHEKLEQITFQGEAENSLVYDSDTIKNIFFKGIQYFVAEDVLTTEDQATLQSLIQRMEIGIDQNLQSKSLINYQISQETGEIHSVSYWIFPHTSQVPVVDMINTFLDDLCQLIVLVKHPNEELHGPYWVEYAEYLLYPEYIYEASQKVSR